MAERAGGLSNLLQGIPIPEIPPESSPAMQKWWREMKEYLRRLSGYFTGVNIYNTIIEQTGIDGFVADWRWNATSHQFEVRRIVEGKLGGWTGATGDQPVNLTRAVTDVNYSTSTHELTENIRADVYVLSMGSETSGVNIDTAVNTC